MFAFMRLNASKMVAAGKIVSSRSVCGGHQGFALEEEQTPSLRWRKRNARGVRRFLPPVENPMSLLREEDVEALLGTLGDGVGPSPGRDEAAGRLRTVRRELAFLASVGFPLPSRLSVEEWVRLLTLRRRASRNRYLDWLGRQGGEGGGEGHHDDGGSGFDSILSAEEAETTTPVRLESSWFSSAAAADGLSDAEVEDRLSLLTSVAEDLRSSGRLLPLLPPKRERHLRELLRAATTDEGAAKALHYLACNRRAEEETDFVLRRARERHRELVTRFQAETRRRVEEEEGRIYYATFSNSIFLRLTKKRMARENRWRVVREFMPWGSPVVVDLSFLGASPPLGAGADGDNNSARLSRRTCSGLKTAVKMNATSRVPSALYFANYDAGAVKELTLLREVFPTDGYGTSSCEAPFLCTSKSHLELFPRSRLVYLSPDSPNELGYDLFGEERAEGSDDHMDLGEAVFVLGGLNESPTGLTLARAEAEDIKHARLPMERHTGFHVDLSIAQVLKIINDYRQTRDWLFSFRWVPCRFFLHRFLTSSGNRDRTRAVLLAHEKLNPELHPAREALTPGQYRRIYLRLLSRKFREEVEDADLSTLDELKERCDIQRLQLAGPARRKKKGSGRWVREDKNGTLWWKSAPSCSSPSLVSDNAA